MDDNSNNMGDNSTVELPEVHGNGNNETTNPGVSKIVATAKLIKNLSQSSLKNVPAEDEDNGNKKLEKQGSTDSAKELAKAVRAATFVRSLSKQSMENGNKNENDESAQEESKEGENESTKGDALAKATKAAKMIRQLSKTAMMVSSNTPSIDEETAGEQNKKSPAAVDVSNVVQATQLIKRLSEQSIEKQKSQKEEQDDTAAGTDDADKPAENEGENNANKEEGNDENQEDKDKDDVETASHDAVLGDDAPETENVDEGFNSDETEEGVKTVDPKVSKAAALVRQLSKQSMTKTGSVESGGETIEGEKTEGRKFKGRWRKSVRDKSREASLEVQEKIVETPEKEGDIAEHPDGENEEDANEKEVKNENQENNKPSSEEVIIKQPSAAVETDGDAIKTIESTEITNPKPKIGFCPCL